MQISIQQWFMPWRWSRWTWGAIAVLMLASTYFTAYLSFARPQKGYLSSGYDMYDHVRLEYEFPDRMSLAWRRRAYSFFGPAHQVDRILRPSVWPEIIKRDLGQDDADFDIDFDWGPDSSSFQPPSHQLPPINPPEPPPMPDRPRIQGPE